MLCVAMIGSGYIGDCHINAYLSLPADFARLTAVIDRNPEAGRKAAEKAGCSWFPTLEEAVSLVQVDVVDICVPTFLHEMFTCQAAAMGKHVLCEKPVTLSLESFDRMYDACKAAGVKFMTGQVVRFGPKGVKVRKLIENGAIGPIHMYSEKRLSQHPAWTTWHRDPEKSGGGLFDLNTHDVDFIYSLFGLPNAVSAVGWKSPSGCWNHVVTTMQWDDMQAVCETSLEMTGSFPFTVGMRAVGDQGTFEYISSAGANIKEQEALERFTLYPAGGEPCPMDTKGVDGFLAEISAFLNAVAEGTEVPIPPAQTRDVVRILLATKKSLEERRTVMLSEV